MDKISKRILHQEAMAERRELLAKPRGSFTSQKNRRLTKAKIDAIKAAQERYNAGLKDRETVTVIAPQAQGGRSFVLGPSGLLWVPGQRYKVPVESQFAHIKAPPRSRR